MGRRPVRAGQDLQKARSIPAPHRFRHDVAGERVSPDDIARGTAHDAAVFRAQDCESPLERRERADRIECAPEAQQLQAMPRQAFIAAVLQARRGAFEAYSEGKSCNSEPS